MEDMDINADEKAAQHYLREVLGEPNIRIQRLAAGANLPYYLTDQFGLSQVSLFGTTIVLANPRPGTQDTGHTRPLQLRKAMDALQSATGLPTAYLCQSMVAYERKRLIEQRIPFIVPANQLYLPTLMLDLREHFVAPRPRRPIHLTPTTQAFFLVALQLLQGRQPTIAAASIGQQLQITPTSVTRAVKDLCAAELITEEATVHRNTFIRLAGLPDQIWKKAQPMLRSPVKRRVWAHMPSAQGILRGPVAGVTALSRKTMISDINPWVHACTAKEWAHAQTMGLQVLPGQLNGSAGQWEIWSYPPTLNSGSQDIDSLSLYLSLRDQSDERVQMALEELLQGTPWSMA